MVAAASHRSSRPDSPKSRKAATSSASSWRRRVPPRCACSARTRSAPIRARRAHVSAGRAESRRHGRRGGTIGGLSTDIIKRGEWRGLRFSGLITIGNSADVAPYELVEYYLEDPQTKVIGLISKTSRTVAPSSTYCARPKRISPSSFSKAAAPGKGGRCCLAHWRAAGDDRAWDALPRQLPVALVSTVEEFLDALLAWQS